MALFPATKKRIGLHFKIMTIKILILQAFRSPYFLRLPHRFATELQDGNSLIRDVVDTKQGSTLRREIILPWRPHESISVINHSVLMRRNPRRITVSPSHLVRRAPLNGLKIMYSHRLRVNIRLAGACPIRYRIPLYIQ